MISESNQELYLMIIDSIKEGRDFTPDEQKYFEKLFDKTVKEMENINA